MAVFRIEKTRDYTVMSNYHLRDMSLSLKAKGLLSLMLSLPENWDYTMKGLARICKDGIDSISGGIRELEAHGYLIRSRVRSANGQLGSIEYTILEQPKAPSPTQEKPIRENPVQANPMLDAPIQENPAQLNKEESSNYGVHPGFLLFRYGSGLVHHCPVFRRCAPFLVVGKAVHFFCPAGSSFIDRVIVDGMHLLHASGHAGPKSYRSSWEGPALSFFGAGGAS